MKKFISKVIRRVLTLRFLDKLFLDFDKSQIVRTNNILLVPNLSHRRGGKVSYGEWCHVIGIFQTLIYGSLKEKTGNRVLDIGCGTGLMGIAAKPFTGEKGEYIGIDVIESDIEFCKERYDNSSFIHHNVNNPSYAPGQQTLNKKWEIKSNDMDLITALSVWTHLNEEDAKFYFKEINRVLKPGGIALITFFLLNQEYYNSLEVRENKTGRYHMSNQKKWIFTKNAYTSKDWFHPNWTKSPEDAIGVTVNGISSLIEGTELTLTKIYNGNWKEKPGVYFQDVLIFEKNKLA